MDNEVVKALLETNKELTQQIVELSKALVESRQPAFIGPPQEFSQHPLWVPETEEDAQHAYASGVIDKTELENALKEIGFYNAEIATPSGL